MQFEIIYDERPTTTYFRIKADGTDYASLRGSGDPLDVQVEATINNTVRDIGYRYVNLDEFQRFAPFRYIEGNPIEQLRQAFSAQSINGQKVDVLVRGGKMPVETGDQPENLSLAA